MYDLTLGENIHFSQNNQPKKPCVFHAPMPLAKANIFSINVDMLVKLNLLKNHDLE
jgi:hypothetical protein